MSVQSCDKTGTGLLMESKKWKKEEQDEEEQEIKMERAKVLSIQWEHLAKLVFKWLSWKKIESVSRKT